MATIKAYTDISQSKKLAKILPLESADMFYDGYKNVLNDDEISYQIDIVSNWTAAYPNKSLFEKSDDTTIPCWSLAALLGVMPINATLLKGGNISSVSDVKYHCEFGMVNTHNWFDNPVDACYELILKLYELNLL